MHYLYRCVKCQKDTYFHFRPEFLNCGKSRPEYPRQEIVHQFPVLTPLSHAAIPTAIAAAAIEAEKCLGVGAYNACGVMTRRAMHSLCENMEAKGKDLFGQLKDLKERQLITPSLHEWADGLRVLGRDGAHPEFPEVTAEDAEDGVNALREVIRYVYILPDELMQKRKKGK
jgi:hypothetical protein